MVVASARPRVAARLRIAVAKTPSNIAVANILLQGIAVAKILLPCDSCRRTNATLPETEDPLT